MINRRNLQHLLVLIKYAHFGRAAKALKISQPALTKSIQGLESDLGVPLLNRKRGALTLTVFGELLVERSKTLLTAEDDLRREISLLAGNEIGSLNVALGPYPSVTSGYAALARMLGAHPKINLSVRVCTWREVANQVATRAVDLGIAEIGGLAGNEQFDAELVAQPRGRFLCRPGHPLVGQGAISLAQLLEYPWVATRIPARIARNLPKSLGAAGSIDPHNGDFVPSVEVDVPMQLGRFLTASNAVAIASLAMMEASLHSGEVNVLPTPTLDFRAGYGFIFLKNRTLSPAALSFMREVRAIEGEMAIIDAALTDKYLNSEASSS